MDTKRLSMKNARYKTFSIISVLSIFYGVIACTESTTEDNSDKEHIENKRIENSSKETQVKLQFENPAIIMGSDLGSLIRKAYQTGDFDLMIAFTASEIIRNTGEKKLLECYQNLDMGQKIKLKSITQANDTLIMNYEADFQATKVVRRLRVIIENDTAKIAPKKPCSGSLYE